MIRRLETTAAAVLIAVLLVSTSAVSLATPGFVSFLLVRTGGPELSRLSEERAVEVGEDVRAYVVGSSEERLPSEVDGRPGFGEDDVAHLEDVAQVFSLARAAAAVTAALVAIWVALCLAYLRTDLLASGLRAAGVGVAAGAALAGMAAVLDFDTFFSAFHGLFFEPGTWTFPEGDLMIALFPEAFWAWAAVAWGALVLIGAVVSWWAGWLILREAVRRHAQKHS